MRVIVLFDLPMITNVEKRQYNKFRNFLLKDGFSMIQFSVYMRFCKNAVDAEKHIGRVKQLSPVKGNIRILSVTEKQYEDMIMVIGTKSATEEYVNSQMTMVIE
ncbi:CRISPR-associated endonuclease Cas2 [Amedibacillus sp. YH-ame6]